MSDERYPVMLQSWGLSNFKSVLNAEIPLQRLTVVAGKNSSGKSTLLQGILLAAQASAQDPGDDAFGLNGALTALGGFDDVRSALSARGDTVDLRARFALERRPVAVGTPLGSRKRMYTRPVELRAVWAISLNGVAANRPGATTVSQVSMEVQAPDGTVDLHLQRQERPIAERRIAQVRGQRLLPVRTPHTVGFAGKVTLTGESDECEAVHGVALVGGVPRGLLVGGTDVEVFAEEWWARHRSRRSFDQTRRARAAQTQLFDEDPIEALVSIAADELGSLRAQPDSSDDDEAAPARALRPHNRRALDLLENDAVAARFSDFLVGLGERAGESQNVLVPSRGVAARLLDGATSELRQFLSSIRYLGPLRHDPTTGPQRSGAFAGGRDIGTRGEHAAPVLYAQRDRMILCPELDGRAERRPLGVALQQWARYLGVVDEVSAVDQGRPGIEMFVRPEGLDRDVDLTNVGVGVSQVLPVLLLCLLTEPGQMVLLEQPELHLHPAMQQRLGDFLLECARTGRQLLVETHSEHIINRLRLRAAEDPGDANVDLFSIVFADRTDGQTTFRPVHANRFGGIDEWPEGFFDQTVGETREILKAGLAKKRRAAELSGSGAEH